MTPGNLMQYANAIGRGQGEVIGAYNACIDFSRFVDSDDGVSAFVAFIDHQRENASNSVKAVCQMLDGDDALCNGSKEAFTRFLNNVSYPSEGMDAGENLMAFQACVHGLIADLVGEQTDDGPVQIVSRQGRPDLRVYEGGG